MPDFLTLVTIAGCAGSSFGFWSLGRSISAPKVLPSSNALNRQSGAQRPLFTNKQSATAGCYGASDSTDGIRGTSPESVPLSRVIISDGHQCSIALSISHDVDARPVVTGKAKGPATSLLVERALDNQELVYFSEELAHSLYHSATLLQPVPETVNIELRHIMKPAV